MACGCTPAAPIAVACSTGCEPDPGQHFARMIDSCVAYARQAKAAGRPVVGILCEFTPRELILAAGAVPVCLCGGSAQTIPAAEQHLPANLCPLIKSTFGYHVLGTNPLLEMADLLVAETTCDGKKKMYELMGQTRPMVVLELPAKPDDADARAHWRRELHKLRGELERRFAVRITDAALRTAIGQMNAERALRRGLAERMALHPPPMTGRQLADFRSSISAIPADLDQYRAQLARVDAAGPDPALAGRARVLLTGVPIVHGAEWVLDLIEDHGGVVVAMENCTGLKPLLEDVSPDAPDPLDALADKYLHLPCSVMTPNDRRLAVLRDLVARYRPQCIVDLTWHCCLTYDVESHRVRQLAQAELGLPYLQIVTDYSAGDAPRLAVRLEALFETLRAAG